LTLSRLDDDGGAQDAEPSDFAAVVRDTVRDLQPLAERRGVQLAIAGADAAIQVAADEETLRQVASNLIDNAIKYTPAAGHVRVSLRRDAGRVRLEVEDTGIGLSPEDQERVFERFYRVDRARSRELGGTGLGLSIVKNTVKRLGGDVGVTSQLGKGSTFRVDLPIVAADEPASATG
jgi:signal transduction histidine kinase